MSAQVSAARLAVVELCGGCLNHLDLRIRRAVLLVGWYLMVAREKVYEAYLLQNPAQLVHVFLTAMTSKSSIHFFPNS